MQLNHSLVSVGTHGEGQPTKVLLSGIPHFEGRSMVEKRNLIQKNYDHLRLALCREPRGHNDQTAAVVTGPVSEGAHLGFLTMDAAGHWADMSVSTAIAVVTVASQYGMISVEAPTTELKIDTPSGLVSARVTVSGGVVESVSIQNVPAFYVGPVSVDVPEIGTISAEIAFGGNFFGFVKASDLGVNVATMNSGRLARMAIAIKNALNASVKVQHPERAYINHIPSVIIDDAPEHAEAQVKAVCVFGEEGGIGIDRSPCGTGLSARMAMMLAKGQIGMNEYFAQESIVGTVFRGKLVQSRKVGDFDAQICEITGRAHIVGVNIATVNLDDPLKFGFTLS